MAKLNVNGKAVDINVDGDTPLLWALREQVGLTGTKYGCGVAQCGACAVHINGEVQRSCSIAVKDVKPADRIVTIEGLSPDGSHAVQKAWLALDVPQVRLLPGRPADDGCGPDLQEAQADRCRHRRGDDQHLSLRNLSAHPRRHSHGGWQQQGLRGGRHDEDSKQDPPLPAQFLVSGAAAGGGLALGFHIPGIKDAIAQQLIGAQGGELGGAWVVIKPNEDVVIRIAPLGDGPGHADRPRPARVRGARVRLEEGVLGVSHARPNLARNRIWGDMSTGGSRASAARTIRAPRWCAARMLLLQAAAEQLKVPVGRAHRQQRRHHARASRGATTTSARSQPPRRAADARHEGGSELKDPKDWKVAGKPAKRLDTMDKLTGKQLYAVDVTLPGMLQRLDHGCRRCMAPRSGATTRPRSRRCPACAMSSRRAIPQS